MAKSKEKKSEIDLKKVIADVVEEEKPTTKKVIKKTSKTVKKSTSKKNKKNPVKKKESKKDEDASSLLVLNVKERRSRKKKDVPDNGVIAGVDNLDNVGLDNKNETSAVEKLEDNKIISDIDENEKNIIDVFDIDEDIEKVKEDEIIKEERKVKKNNMNNPTEKKPFPKVAFVGVAVVAILVFAIVIATKTMKTVIPNVSSVNNISDLNNKLEAKLVAPKDVKNIQYGIEGDRVARIDYARTSPNGTMNIVFRMSKDPDKDLYGETHNWGERVINIDVVCDDGTIINVESFEALDDNMTLVALWKDNNEYYSLFTKNVSTREDFYREVNQLVAANHKAEK